MPPLPSRKCPFPLRRGPGMPGLLCGLFTNYPFDRLFDFPYNYSYTICKESCICYDLFLPHREQKKEGEAVTMSDYAAIEKEARIFLPRNVSPTTALIPRCLPNTTSSAACATKTAKNCFGGHYEHSSHRRLLRSATARKGSLRGENLVPRLQRLRPDPRSARQALCV